MTFVSRAQAGDSLGRHLLERNIRADLVLGLPRGGVVVAAAVADLLRCPLDVIVVRKIGHPFFREFAVGALAEDDVVLLNEEAIKRTGVHQNTLEAVITEEKQRLHDYQQKFRRTASATLQGRRVLIVDDGLATGSTTEAAVLSAKKRQAERVLLAVPVSSQDGFQRLARTADEVIALSVDPAFEAVGQYYRQFPQTTDDEVLELLARHRES